nr:MAG TPA_asm: hypothetical protein [Caudoviricetes sp.]
MFLLISPRFKFSSLDLIIFDFLPLGCFTSFLSVRLCATYFLYIVMYTFRNDNAYRCEAEKNKREALREAL